MLVAIRTLRRLGAAFLLGAFVGSLAVSALAARQLESLRVERDLLLTHASELRNRIAKLEEALADHRRPVVRDVEVIVEGLDDDRLREEVRRRLAPLAEELIGRRLDGIDPDLAVYMFDGRTIQVEDRQVVVSVRVLLLAERSRIALRAQESPNAEGGGGVGPMP